MAFPWMNVENLGVFGKSQKGELIRIEGELLRIEGVVAFPWMNVENLGVFGKSQGRTDTN